MMVQPNPIALNSKRVGGRACKGIWTMALARKPICSAIGEKNRSCAALEKNYSAGPNTASILAFSVAALNGLTM
jgi:hypothetical protein